MNPWLRASTAFVVGYLRLLPLVSSGGAVEVGSRVLGEALGEASRRGRGLSGVLMGKDRPIDLGGVLGMLLIATSTVVSIVLILSCNPWASKVVSAYSVATACSVATTCSLT